MMQLGTDYRVEPYTLILSRRNHKHLGQLRNVEHVVTKSNLNSANELSFTVYQYNKDTRDVEPLWNEITDFKYIYVKELDEFYEIKVDLSDGTEICKNVTGISACEAELSQSYLYGLEINTELDIARKDYTAPTVFYKPDKPSESLLHRVLYKMPHYSIKHVDNSLKNIQRTFNADGTDVYSFLTGDVATEVQCLFLFDTVDRSISAYDLQTVCKKCGKRGDFEYTCPECGSTDLKFYGEDTTIYVDKENLAENITFTTDTDSVKNCFKLEAGDENMTAAVINCNPNGSGYLYYFSADQKHDMSPELVQKLGDYDKLVDSYKPEYSQIMLDTYNYLDKIAYYTSSMMPTREHFETNATKEAAKLTAANLSPTGLTAVSASTSVATVNTALKMHAKIYVKSGYFKIEVNEGAFTYVGKDSLGNNYGNWTGNFKITSYADEEDTAISSTITVKIDDDYKTYLEQKIAKNLVSYKDDDGTIFDVLGIKDLALFKTALTHYCLNRLISFHDAIQGVIDILIEEGQANPTSLLYKELFLPYREKLNACQLELNKRDATVKNYKDRLAIVQKRQREIQKALDFETYLGNVLYSEFCCYRREDKYSNENYVSDGLSNDEIFKRAKEFIEVAQEELVKSGEYQHSISASLYNLLAMKEFKPLTNKFKLGNFIHIRTDEKLYRLRLISYQIDFDSLDDIDVEFSDLTKARTTATDLEDILNQAHSMATSYDSVKHQVKVSKEQTDTVRSWVQDGLSTTNVKIVNNASNQNIIWGDTGFLARRKDDITDEYDDCQLKIINNGLYTTSDGWKSIDTAVGKSYITDPKTGEQKLLFGIQAKHIVGGLIAGENLSIQSPDGSFIVDQNGVKLQMGGVVGLNDALNKQEQKLDTTITSQEEQYYVSTSPTVLNGGSWSTIAPTWKEGTYIWRRFFITLGDGSTRYVPSDKGICINGNTGAAGTNGVGISKVENYYLASSSNTGVTTLTPGWSTTPPNTTEQNKYLWNYEQIVYTNGHIEKTKPIVIGTYGKIGKDGKGIRIVEEFYQVSTSNITAPTSWVTSVPKMTPTNKYLWNYEKITYTDNSVTETSKRVIGAYGDKGQDGINGVGIRNVVNYYLASPNSSGITTSTQGWTTAIQEISVTKKFLWNYEEVTYTDGKITKTEPCIIGTYGRDGVDGTNGNGIKTITEYYQISTSGTNPPTTWVTTPPTLTPTNKYLWNYEKIVYTNGTSAETQKKVIGVYGDKGQDGVNGVGIKNVVNYYLASSSGSGITTSTPGWTIAVQEISASKKYLWNYEEITYTNSEIMKTKPCVIGTYGRDGVDGTNGNGIKTITEYYQVSVSGTNPPGTWVLTPPPLTPINKYLWNYERIDYTNGNFVETTKKVIGVYGDKGQDGQNGKDGKGIRSTVIDYQANVSGVNIPTGTWSPNIPTVAQGQYLWSRTTITYTDNTTSKTYSVAYIPKNGVNGQNGAAGQTGTGIASMVQQYYLSDSKTTQTGGSWITTMPQWSIGKYLWTRYQINYKNPTSTTYTTPVCDSSWEAVNNIQVGGRNLIIGSGNVTRDFEHVSGAIVDGGYLGNKATATKTGWAKTYIHIKDIATRNNFQNGITVTASIYVSVDSEIEVTTPMLHLYGGKNGTNVDDTKHFSHSINLIKGKWERLVATYKIDDISLLANNMRFECGADTTYNILWSCPQLEIGNTPTDWTPAPEDIQEEMQQNIQDSINQNNITIETNYNSVIEQTKKDILSRVSKVETIVGPDGSVISKLTSDIKQAADNVTTSIKSVKEIKNDITGIIEKKEVIESMEFNKDGVLVIKSSNSNFSMQLSKSELGFYQGEEKVAWINNNELHIKNAIVTNGFVVGNDTERLTLQYEGANGWSFI